MAKGTNKVFCELSIVEFEYLIKTPVDDIANGVDTSLTWVKNIIDSIANYQTFIQDAKTAAEALVIKLGYMLQ